jgi:hypothetical protein
MHHNSDKVLEFRKDMHICYDIVIKNIRGFNKIDFCFESTVIYSKTIKNNHDKYIAIKIKLFTKNQPLLLTHIVSNMLNFKLYKQEGSIYDDNINISYTYEKIDTHKYSTIWNYIPVTHCFNNTFLLYKNNAIKTMHISEAYKNKNALINQIKLYKEEWHVEIYVDNSKLQYIPQDIPQDIKQDIKQIKHLYNNIEVSQSNTCCIRFFINDNIKLQEFIKYANIKWKSYNVVLKQIEYDINSNTYINMNNLITDIAN